MRTPTGLHLTTSHYNLKVYGQASGPDFDTVEVAPNLDSRNLREAITHFLQTYGNNQDERLFIYYAGHGYDEIIGDRNELRGYITGIDTPRIDGTPRAYDAAAPRLSPWGADPRAFGRRSSKIHSCCV